MKRLLAATALTLITASCPLYAQSAVEMTLEQYIAMGNGSGGAITYDAKDSGADYVQYNGFRLASPGEDMVISTDWIRATEVGGMVTLTFAPTVNVSIKTGAEPTSFVVSSDALAITTNVIVPDPTTLTSYHVDLTAGSLKVGDLSGDTSVLSVLNVEQANPVISFDFDMMTMKAKGGWQAGALNAAYAFAVDGMSQSVDMTQSDMNLVFDMDIPQGEQDMPAFISGQKNAMLKMTAGAASGTGSMSQDGMAFDYTMEGGPSSIEASIQGGDMLINAAGGPVAYSVTPTGMPMPPVDVSLQSMLMNIAVPFSATQAPGDINVALKFADLAIGEGAWSMIDPGQTLPRDPLNVDIDLTATAQFSPDLMMAAMMDPMSAAKFSDLTVNSFLISAAGAKLTGTGGLTFDPNLPMPLPTGVITLGLDGATTLAQKLADLGLLPPDQVGMLGMMLGMYGKAVGEDSYSSDVEFKGMEPPTVNGQPLPL